MADDRSAIHRHVVPPMTPIFDAQLRLVGFFDGTHLFDLDNEWVAFHERGHVFTPSGRWLGAMLAGSFLDADGHPVGWLAGSQPTSGSKSGWPPRPKLPLPPRRPLRPRVPIPPSAPLRPAGGWSRLGWAEWMGEAAPSAANGIDVAALTIAALADADFEAFFRYLGD